MKNNIEVTRFEQRAKKTVGFKPSTQFSIDRTSCLLYLYTHSDRRMTRTSCLLYLYTHSDCRMTRTSCLLYLCTHSDCRMTIITFASLTLCQHVQLIITTRDINFSSKQNQRKSQPIRTNSQERTYSQPNNPSSQLSRAMHNINVQKAFIIFMPQTTE